MLVRLRQPIARSRTGTRGRAPRPRRVGAAILTVLVPLVAACGGAASGAGNGASTIVVVTDIWADVVEHVACTGAVDVDTLVPAGADPHSTSLSLADRGRLERASLVVANGLGLEGGLDDTLEDVESHGVEVFRIGDHVAPLLSGAEHVHDDDGDDDGAEHGHDDGDGAGHDHDHTGADPHVWFDPARVGAVLPELATAVADATGLDPVEVRSCAERYRAQLDAVDAEIAGLVETIPAEDRLLVTSHGALGYFADRYGLTVVGTVLPGTSTLARATPADLEALAARIDAQGVPAVFTDTLASDDDTTALARRLDGVTVVPLFTEALGPSGSGADSYTGLLLTDAGRIATALGGAVAPSRNS